MPSLAHQLDPKGSRTGVVVFVTLCFGSSWLLAALISAPELDGRPTALTLFRVSLHYALTMGLQPLAAALLVRRWVDTEGPLDAGLGPSEPRYLRLAALLALAVLLSAALAKWALTPALTAPLGTALEIARALEPKTWAHSLLSALLLCASLLCLWLQALSEELGFRGYLLARSRELFGPGRGAWFHALIWGVWYAPLMLLLPAGGGFAVAGQFVVTCTLLGVLFAALRASSGSIVPSCVANALLTMAAGLPLLLQGRELGLRAASYEPWGWLPLGLAVLLMHKAGRLNPKARSNPLAAKSRHGDA